MEFIFELFAQMLSTSEQNIQEEVAEKASEREIEATSEELPEAGFGNIFEVINFH